MRSSLATGPTGKYRNDGLQVAPGAEGGSALQFAEAKIEDLRTELENVLAERGKVLADLKDVIERCAFFPRACTIGWRIELLIAQIERFCHRGGAAAPGERAARGRA